MGLYRIYAKQYLPIAREEAWDFLANPKNLAKITPPQMGFSILSGGESKMYAGQIIQYRISPFKGIHTHWVTEITHVRDGSYFVDEQRFGPYSFWHHKHFLTSVAEGTLMEDIIDYKLPLGPLGNMAQKVFVKKQLGQIFSFREQELASRFGRLLHESSEFEITPIKL